MKQLFESLKAHIENYPAHQRLGIWCYDSGFWFKCDNIAVAHTSHADHIIRVPSSSLEIETFILEF